MYSTSFKWMIILFYPLLYAYCLIMHNMSTYICKSLSFIHVCDYKEFVLFHVCDIVLFVYVICCYVNNVDSK